MCFRASRFSRSICTREPCTTVYSSFGAQRQTIRPTCSGHFQIISYRSSRQSCIFQVCTIFEAVWKSVGWIDFVHWEQGTSLAWRLQYCPTHLISHSLEMESITIESAGYIVYSFVTIRLSFQFSIFISIAYCTTYCLIICSRLASRRLWRTECPFSLLWFLMPKALFCSVLFVDSGINFGIWISQSFVGNLSCHGYAYCRVELSSSAAWDICLPPRQMNPLLEFCKPYIYAFLLP